MYGIIARASLPAVAATSGSAVLSKVVSLLTGGIGFLGGAMIVWGAVTIGINVHNGAAAAAYFGTLDLSWV